MTRQFTSAGDLAEKRVSFSEVGKGLWRPQPRAIRPLPFDVARAYDAALDIDTPRIWTAERDRQMWEAMQA